MADHNFNPLLAKKYGINLAIIINTAIFWTRSNAAKEDNFFNERYWFYGTPEYFSKYFPYFTPDQIKYALKKGKQCGVFIKGNFNKKGYDRTGWYSLSDDILEEINLDRTCLYPYGYNSKQNGQNIDQETPQTQSAPHRVKLPNASGKITPTIPVNKSINKKDIKTTTTVNHHRSSSSFFTKKQQEDLLNQKLESDLRSDETFLLHCQHHIEKQENDFGKFQRMTGLRKILENAKAVGERFKSPGFIDPEQLKIQEANKKLQELKSEHQLYWSRFNSDRDVWKREDLQGKEPKGFEEWIISQGLEALLNTARQKASN